MAIGGTSLPLALAPREHDAHVVGGDRAAQRLGRGSKPVAHLPVEVGQRQPADAALGRAADGGRLHQAAPQALRIGYQVAHGTGELEWFSMGNGSASGPPGLVATSAVAVFFHAPTAK